MRTAILTLFATSVLGKFRGTRIQDLLNNANNLPDPQHIIEKLKPHVDRINEMAEAEAEKVSSHFKDARSKYDQN